MELYQYIGVNNVVTFMLLFARFSGLVAFFPFFSHLKIPIVIKTALVFLLSLFSFSYAHVGAIEINVFTITLVFLSEILLGLISGLSLYLLFAALQLAGEQMSFVMGFTMASVMDPGSGLSFPLISQFFTILGICVFLVFNGHHYVLMLYFHSLEALPLGEFYPNVTMWQYISKGVLNLFVLGFIISFPIKALSLLADLIFGMLMKAMPQFNLLVVGFPIKIMIGFAILIATLSAIFSLFKTQALQILEQMYYVFFQ